MTKVSSAPDSGWSEVVRAVNGDSLDRDVLCWHAAQVVVLEVVNGTVLTDVSTWIFLGNEVAGGSGAVRRPGDGGFDRGTGIDEVVDGESGVSTHWVWSDVIEETVGSGVSVSEVGLAV